MKLSERAIAKREGWRASHGIGARRRNRRAESSSPSAAAIVPAGEAGALSVYDQACRAVAAAKTVDEAKEVRDKAEAMRVYARQAKNRGLEVDAAEIRLRAERRLGELLVEQKEAEGLNAGTLRRGAETEPRGERPTLADLGVDKKLSARAQKYAAVPEEEFERTVEAWRERVGNENERVSVTLVDAGAKAEHRARREAELAERITALPDRKFGVIYADPEWRFEPWSRVTGMDRAPDNHYPTSPVEVIKARPVEAIAADDAVLFLWATAPMLREALEVMAAWGFDYKTHIVWRKVYPGTMTGPGYWARFVHELLLIGTRGNVPAPLPGTQPLSVIEAEVILEGGRVVHSAKPDVFAEIIETHFPTVSKIELNRRGPPRAGWVAWGNEAEESHVKT